MHVLEGIAWTLLLNAPLGLGGYWLARHGFRQPRGWPRAIGAAVLAWTWMTLGVQALGSFGLLTRGPLLGWSLAGLAIGAVSRLARPGVDEPAKPAEDGWDAAATIALGLVFWATLLYLASSVMMPVKVVSDGPIYHLYFAARWWKEGRLFLIATPFGETAAPYFPANGDAWFAWLFVGYAGERLAKIGQAPFLLLAALTTYALARRLGAGRPSSAIAACWFASSTPLILFSFEGNVDTIFVAGYLGACFFLREAARGDGGPRELALAALAAGLAWGTKPTATVFIPPLLVLGGLGVLARHRPAATRLRDLLILCLVPLIPSGYWFGRNAWLTGNPLYPAHVELFGRLILRGWFTTEAMKESQFYIPRGAWVALSDILMTVFDFRLVLLWLPALLGAWAIGRGRRPSAGWVWLCAGLAVVNVLLYWFVIPYRSQQRFMLQAVALAAVPLARLLDRAALLRLAASGLLAVHFLTPMSWPFARAEERPPWHLSPMVPTVPAATVPFPLTAEAWERVASDFRRQLDLGLTLARGSAALGLAWLWARSIRRPTRGRRLVAVSATLGLLLIDVGGFVTYIRADRFRFPFFADYYRAWVALDTVAGPAGARVAYAGTNIPYYLMGGDLRNEVRYINVDRHRDWLLHDYHLDAVARGEKPLWDTPRPGWDRIHPDYEAWLANLRVEGIEFLVVARSNKIDGPFNVVTPDGFPIERAWADAHPEAFTRIFGPDDGSPLMCIYRVSPGPDSGRRAENRPIATDRLAGSH